MRRRKSSLQSPFLRQITALEEKVERGNYPFDIPLFNTADPIIKFSKPITFFVGENGTGKSTVLEAIAMHCGFHAAGGSRDHSYSEPVGRHSLSNALRLSWLPKVTNGFFFRAETFFSLSSYIDDLSDDWPIMQSYYGEKKLNSQSHGEAFLSLFENRLGSDMRSIYLLDEPESALSPSRQLEFLKIIDEWRVAGNVQAIIATHSPILMCYPYAEVLHFSEDGVSTGKADQTSHFNLYKRFFEDPAEFIRNHLNTDSSDD